MNTELIFPLLIIYQFKHFLADYLLQTKYHLGKFKDDWNFFLPLLSHTLVHGVFTFLIVYTIVPALALPLALFDIVIHFVMDRIKAGSKYLGRFKDIMKPQFWWCLGFDQMVHHLTHYFIIWLLISV
ncbi:hypothetical protein CMI47_13325 [Candidatus Pacearchaeota archaeon]|nr:hypothetical protein [Candidatus Pacearchaeota archaeon]|tara:strand:+ start:56 stop:436 length:381 start_codon:yes stop_codon:yes gene_type:complete